MRKKLSLSLLAAAVAALATTASASATPSGEYEVFAQCPYNNPIVEGCVYAKTESGEFVVGNKTVPISKTITLQAGIYENEETEEKFVVAATNGETLSKTPQNVPGGLAGLVNCTEISNIVAKVLCEVTFENGLTGVTATTELANGVSGMEINPGKVLSGVGLGLKLPIKVHLENPFLGSECYMGSASSPIQLRLTSGTTSPPPPNTPITGKGGELHENAEGTIATVTGNELVDNSFAAPGVSGCGGLLSAIIDPVVDAELGTPSEAGHNTAILAGSLKSANARIVREHA